MTEDQQLLQRYVRDATPQALDELVRRYRDLVYSSALRQVRDPHLAEDVAQAVFIILSKKAPTIRQGVALGGWLLAVTRRAALNAMKKQAIQHRHECAAAKTEAFETAEANWEQIDPVLDSVMSRLSSKERDAVVLRYFQDRSFAQVGAELGLSEEAARKRVERAIERMRGILRQKGVSIGAAALGVTITSHSVHAAPATIAAISTSISATNIAKGVITMMKLAQLKALAVAAAIFLLISGGAVLVVTAMAQQQDAVRQVPPAPPTTAPFDANAARAAIVLRFQTLQNISVSYRTERFYPAVGAADPSPTEIVKSRLGDKIRTQTHDKRIQGRSASGPSDVNTTNIITSEFYQSLSVVSGGGMDSISGTTGAQARTGGDLVDWALGLAGGSPSKTGHAGLTLADIDSMEIVPGPSGRVLMNHVNEQKNTEQWEFRPEMGYAISAFRILNGPEKRLNVEVVIDDFKMVHGLMLPHTVTERSGAIRDGKWSETLHITATVAEYKVQDPANTDARYQIKWPAGAKVTDGPSQTKFIAGDDGKLVPAKP